jgi:hypothetical protein
MLIGEVHHPVVELYKLFLERIVYTYLLDDPEKAEKAYYLRGELGRVKTLSSNKKEEIIKSFKPCKLLIEGLEYGKQIPEDELEFLRVTNPGIVEACEYLGCEVDGLENKITYLSIPLAIRFARFPGMMEYLMDKRNEVFAKNILEEVEKGTERVCAVVGYTHLTGHCNIKGKNYSFSKLQDEIEKMNDESYGFELKTYVRIPLEERELEILTTSANDFLKSLSNYTTLSRR